MKTEAEKFAALFDDNGQVFETTDSRSFDEVMEAMGAEAEYSTRVYNDTDGDYHYESGYSGDYTCGDPIRYEFADGSCIVVAGEAWDFEGDEQFSWRG